MKISLLTILLVLCGLGGLAPVAAAGKKSGKGKGKDKSPTRYPTKYPTKHPTAVPTKQPTKLPTKSPTKFPTKQPTKLPTAPPTKLPTAPPPTNQPTDPPTTTEPTEPPTKEPTRKPTKPPTMEPTERPTSQPTDRPTDPQCTVEVSVDCTLVDDPTTTCDEIVEAPTALTCSGCPPVTLCFRYTAAACEDPPHTALLSCSDIAPGPQPTADVTISNRTTEFYSQITTQGEEFCVSNGGAALPPQLTLSVQVNGEEVQLAIIDATCANPSGSLTLLENYGAIQLTQYINCNGDNDCFVPLIYSYTATNTGEVSATMTEFTTSLNGDDFFSLIADANTDANTDDLRLEPSETFVNTTEFIANCCQDASFETVVDLAAVGEDGRTCSDTDKNIITKATVSAPPTKPPTIIPTTLPTKLLPTRLPTPMPVIATAPPQVATDFPSRAPSASPTTKVSDSPTEVPSGSPSNTPSVSASNNPSNILLAAPSNRPSNKPSSSPTQATAAPSYLPSSQPSSFPTLTNAGTAFPTTTPSYRPSRRPSRSFEPSFSPSQAPTAVGTAIPTTTPSYRPSRRPSRSFEPSSSPTQVPTSAGTVPTTIPSYRPSKRPSRSFEPSSSPTQEAGTISGVVLEITETNSNFTAPDLPIAGVFIELRNEVGTTAQTTRTDSNGVYFFFGVLAGSYTIEEESPLAGFVDVRDSDGPANGDSTISVTLDEDGALSEGNNFFEARIAIVAGNVTEDINNDGTGEDPIAGVTVQICDQANPSDDCRTTATDSNGNFSFHHVTPGFYCVFEINNPGFVDVGDSLGNNLDEMEGSGIDDPNVVCIVVAGGVDVTTIEFVDELSNEQPSTAPSSLATPSGTKDAGTISGSVFEDIDILGDFSAGDIPISGVSILLRSADNSFVVITHTDSNGAYSFTGVLGGSYTIEQEFPLPGLIDVRDTDGPENGDNIIAVFLPAGGSSGGNDFLEARVTTVAGNVTEDIDNDDEGEVPISGVTVQICERANVTDCRTTVTDSDGTFSFNGIPPGDFCVIETNNEGFVDVRDSLGDNMDEMEDSGEDDPNVVCLMLSGGADVPPIEFVDELPSSSPSSVPPPSQTSGGTISGRVLEDIDGLGDFSTGDLPISGVLIQLKLIGGSLVLTTVTDSNGGYSFEGVPAGTYTIQEEFPLPGLVDVKDSDGPANGDNTIVVTLLDGDSSTGNNFLEVRVTASSAPTTPPSAPPTTSGSISGTVYQDIDAMGDFSPGDLGIAGILIELRLPDGAVVATTITDSDGAYSFEGVTADSYMIEEESPLAGFLDVKDTDGPANGNNTIAVTLPAGGESVNNSFLEVRLSNVTGNVTEDINSDDEGEDPISGVPVHLCDRTNPSGCIATATDSNGDFGFENVLPGEYCVIQTNVGAFIDVSDSLGDNLDEMEDSELDDPNIVCFAVVGGVNVPNIQFVDELPSAEPSSAPSLKPTEQGSISGLVLRDNDADGDFSAGDVGIAGVTILLRRNGNPISQMQTGPDGSYSFTGLQGGITYMVREDPNIPGVVDVSDTGDSPEGTNANGNNEIQIVLAAGEQSQNNNFLEAPDSGRRLLRARG